MSFELKERILQTLIEQIEQKLAQLKFAIDDIKVSRNDQTKSSAGDKYETSRAMMEQELLKLETQKQQSLQQLQHLSKIDLNKTHDKVAFGSLVESTNQFYFISIGYGKITVDDKTIFVISLNSPLGKALEGKEKGETVMFKNLRVKLFTIL
ncbi:MAG: GreA/GreB family elongation factor [Bacteroidales bacterium]|nr:GreA/GreB family elongation factor [Bacteroidales bacterium]